MSYIWDGATSCVRTDWGPTSLSALALQQRTRGLGRQVDRESAVRFSSDESQLVCCASKSRANVLREDI